MSFESLLIHEVTVHVVTSGLDESRYGDPVDTTTTVTYSARVEQENFLSGQEEIASEDRRRSYFNVFLPADADVDGVDYLDWGDRRLQIISEPSVVAGRFGPHHIELRAEEILGG